MFLYESKKPAASTKAASSNKSADSGRRVRYTSSPCQNNRPEFIFTVQKMPIPTASAPKSENSSGAGSTRPPHNELPPALIDDESFIESVLSSNDWRERIESDRDLRSRAEQILDHWQGFLLRFLEHCGFMPYGAKPSLTYHRPGSNDTAESPEGRDREKVPKINRMYEHSFGKRESRGYGANEEIKRYLRHCAAALKIIFGLKSEIQCYYDDKDKVVYVATNDQNAEQKISMIDFPDVLQHSLNELFECPDNNDSSSVWSEFKGSLSTALSSGDMAARRFRHALTCPAALRGATFKLIRSSDVNVKIHGLHAERKILYYLRSQKNDENFFLDPLRLGGIRRPCFVCSALCFADMSQVRQGPCWVSGAASKPNDIKEMFLILDAIRNKNNITYITDNNGHLTTDCDTESSEGSECD